MSALSNPSGPVTTNDPQDSIRKLSYRGTRIAGGFLLEGEDAYWLLRLADERNMTVDALVKQFTIEGLWRARTFKEL